MSTYQIIRRNKLIALYQTLNPSLHIFPHILNQQEKTYLQMENETEHWSLSAHLFVLRQFSELLR